MKILISNNPAYLREALSRFDRFATVEAEYGEELVEGSSPELTLAHHGSRSANPPPCVGGIIEVEGLEAIGLSHFDLDSLGGVIRLLGNQNLPGGAFQIVAGEVDIRGPHRLTEILAKLPTQELQDRTRRELQAFWAWSESNKLFPPRDGAVLNCTEFVLGAIEVLGQILAGDEELLAQGNAWATSKEELASSSYVKRVRNNNGPLVLVRSSDQFTNHLYSHDGEVAHAVVSYNSLRETVTLSLEAPVEGVSCCAIAQELWGPEAGGHAGIAGSPRDKSLPLSAALEAAAALVRVLGAAILCPVRMEGITE